MLRTVAGDLKEHDALAINLNNEVDSLDNTQIVD